MKNIFDQKETHTVIERINQLEPAKQPKWGKMRVDQMLAHCNVTYEMVFEDKHPKPNALKRFMLKTFIKSIVVGEKPYRKNGRTSREFLITDVKNFETEKERLVNYLKKTQDLGENHFDNKESLSFGKLTKIEWNNMFYNHIDHHLRQFGV